MGTKSLTLVLLNVIQRRYGPPQFFIAKTEEIEVEYSTAIGIYQATANRLIIGSHVIVCFEDQHISGFWFYAKKPELLLVINRLGLFDHDDINTFDFESR